LFLDCLISEKHFFLEKTNFGVFSEKFFNRKKLHKKIPIYSEPTKKLHFFPFLDLKKLFSISNNKYSVFLWESPISIHRRILSSFSMDFTNPKS